MIEERDSWLQGVLGGTEPNPAERDAAVAAYREKHQRWLDCGAWLDRHLDDPRYPERSARLVKLTMELSRDLETASQLTKLSRRELIALAERSEAA